MPMGPNSKKVAEDAQAKLTAQLNDFLGNVEAMRPTVSDKKTFNQLVDAVKMSTSANESVGAFAARLKGAGSAVLSLAKTLGLFA